MLCIESWVALLFGFVFGVTAVVFVPPVVTYDGPSHYLRALQVSEGQMRADRFSASAVGGVVPKSHADFMNSILWSYYWKPGNTYMDRAQWAALSSQEARVPGTTRVEFTNTAIYSPVNYAFQSLGMRLAAALSPSPLLASQLGCLFNLAGYLLLVVCAIECAPRFRRGVVLLASSPLVLIQASSLSADAINFTLPLLVLAWTWRLRTSLVKRPGVELAALLALGLLVTLLKPTLFTVLLCLLFVPSRFFGGARFAKAAGLAAYFLLVACVWFAWNRPNLGIDVARWYDTGRPAMSVQMHWFLGNPLRFAGPFMALLAKGIGAQWPHFYGDPGYWMAPWAYPFNAALSVVFLAGFLGCASWSGAPDRGWAMGMLIVALAVIFLAALALWLAFGTVGMDFVPGYVGRYLFVPVLAFGFAWAERFHRGFGNARSVLYWTALTANAAALAAILVPVALRTW